MKLDFRSQRPSTNPSQISTSGPSEILHRLIIRQAFLVHATRETTNSFQRVLWDASGREHYADTSLGFEDYPGRVLFGHQSGRGLPKGTIQTFKDQLKEGSSTSSMVMDQLSQPRVDFVEYVRGQRSLLSNKRRGSPELSDNVPSPPPAHQRQVFCDIAPLIHSIR